MEFHIEFHFFARRCEVCGEKVRGRFSLCRSCYELKRSSENENRDQLGYWYRSRRG